MRPWPSDSPMALAQSPEMRRADENLRARRKLTAKRSQQAGAVAQLHAAAALRAAGFWMVEEIATPMAKIKGRMMRVRKVSGDVRAVVFGGRSLLAEVKCRPGVLIHSDFEKHQVAALDLHASVGGASLVAWVREGQVALLQWPIEGFTEGTSIDWERACSLAIRSVRDLSPTLVKPVGRGNDTSSTLCEVPHGAH